MNYTDELRYRVARTGYVTAVLAFAAFGAGVATFFGLSALIPGDKLEATLVPIITAIVIGCGLFAIWHKVLNIVPLLHDPVKRTSGIAISVALTAVTIAISSWFIATSIGGEQAVLSHMKANVEKFEGQLRLANENAISERDLIPDVLRVAAELEAIADAEEKVGALSGVKGNGQVVQMLRGAAASYRHLANDMTGMGHQVSNQQNQAEALIGDLIAIINSEDGSSMEGQRRFSDITIALQAVLTKMDRTSLLPAIKRHGILNVEYAEVSRGQKRAIQNVTSSMEKFTERLSEEAQRTEKRRNKLSSISFAPMNPGMATWQYAGDVAAAWAVGLGVDFLPLIMLLVLMVGHAEARQPYEPRQPFNVIEGGRAVNS